MFDADDEAGRATASPRREVLRGVEIYRQAFVQAGGREIRALMRSGAGASVCVASYAAPPCDLHVPAMPVGRLSVNLTRACVQGGLEREPARDFEAERYSLFLAHAGARAHWRKEAPSRHLTIFFHPQVFDGGATSQASLLERHSVANAQLAGTRDLIDALADEFARPSLYDAEVVDSLSRLLLARVARNLQVAAHPLTAQVLDELRRYVDGHLGERILVADLAQRVGLSASRFAGLFNAQTGQSPYQFVLSLRLARATELLTRSRLSLVQIAHECGFSNQQHLSTTVRRHLGTTPSRLRAAGADAGKDSGAGA